MKWDIDLKEVASFLGLEKGSKRNSYYCPIHDSETPDLFIEPDCFQCFGSSSNNGGFKAISLIMHVKNCSKESAFDYLKQMFPSKFDDYNKEEYKRERKASKVLNKVTELAHKELVDNRDGMKNEIISKRRFDEKTLKDVKIGYFSEEISNKLKQEFDNQTLIDSGLFTNSPFSSHLVGRILYPYQNLDETKYIIGGTPPSKNYNQKYKKLVNTDYNRHILLEYNNNSSNDVIITEGVTDAISAYKAGYNTISPVTTKVREVDIPKLVEKVKTYDNIYIVMDSDESGKNGALTIGDKLIENGLVPDVIEFDETDTDLDEWTSKNGYILRQLIDDSEDYIEYKLKQIDEGKSETKLIDEILSYYVDSKPLEQGIICKKLSDSKYTTEGRKTTYEKQLNELDKQKEKDKQKEVELDSTTSELEELAEMEEPNKYRLSGITNDGKFFLTFWVYDINTDNYKKKIITDDLKVYDINYDEEKDYEYAEVGNERVIFKHEIPNKPDANLYRPDNGLLKYTLNEKDIPSKEELYDEIRNTIIDYWDHHDENWYDIATSYIIHSYLSNIIGQTFYIYMLGKEDTGKTQFQKITSRMMYNSINLENTTAPAMIRFVHNYQASAHFEELDKMGGDTKEKIQGFLNSGNRKGTTYTIADAEPDKIQDQTKEIYTFSPKTISANDSRNLADSFESRTLVCQATRTNRKVENPDKIDDKPEKKKKMRDLRNKITAFILENWEDIIDNCERRKKEYKSEGRESERISMFTGIVQYFCDSEKADKVENTIESAIKLSEFGAPNKYETIILEYIINEFNQANLNSKDDEISLTYMEIKEAVNSDNRIDDDANISSRGVGRKLRKYQLERYDSQKSKNSSGRTKDSIPYKYVEDSIERFGLDEYLDIELLEPINQSEQSELDSQKDISNYIDEDDIKTVYEDNIETVY